MGGIGGKDLGKSMHKTKITGEGSRNWHQNDAILFSGFIDLSVFCYHPR